MRTTPTALSARSAAKTPVISNHQTSRNRDPPPISEASHTRDGTPYLPIGTRRTGARSGILCGVTVSPSEFVCERCGAVILSRADTSDDAEGIIDPAASADESSSRVPRAAAGDGMPGLPYLRRLW